MDDAAPCVPRTAASGAYRWRLLAEPDPQLPARVLAAFGQRNRLPDVFHLDRLADGLLRIELRAESECDDAARRLALRLCAIPTVIEVGLWAPDESVIGL